MDIEKKDGHKNQFKLLINGKHFAWLDTEYIRKIDSMVGNRAKWIRKCCREDFGIELSTLADFEELDKQLTQNLFKDKADWLRAKIREENSRVTVIEKLKIKHLERKLSIYNELILNCQRYILDLSPAGWGENQMKDTLLSLIDKALKDERM